MKTFLYSKNGLLLLLALSDPLCIILISALYFLFSLFPVTHLSFIVFLSSGAIVFLKCFCVLQILLPSLCDLTPYCLSALSVVSKAETILPFTINQFFLSFSQWSTRARVLYVLVQQFSFIFTHFYFSFIFSVVSYNLLLPVDGLLHFKWMQCSLKAKVT